MTSTSQSYPRLAFCSAITPADPAHYLNLRKAGIDTASICLHVSGFEYYKFATIHTQLARKADLATHAFMITDLLDPFADVTTFFKRFNQLGYDSNAKITVWVNGDKYVADRESKIIEIIDLIAKCHNRENIDLAFFKRDIDDKLYDLSKMPQMINLTIINCEGTGAGIDTAGTWIYTMDFCNEVQVLGYDYYGYYTDDAGYQLSLVDTDYVVQEGDTWYSISRRHGIPLNDLLALNRAIETERVFAGQVVRIA